MKSIYIIDALAMAFRTFYGLKGAGLSTASGHPVSTIYGSALFIGKLIKDYKPDYLVAVADSPLPNFRHKLYPDYKGHRDEMPDNLKKQLPGFWRLFEAFSIPIVRQDGIEADDLIGSLVEQHRGENKDLLFYIVSGDKDFMQLIDERTFLFSPKKNQPPVITGLDGVAEKFGCPPSGVVEALALMGDSADNIPGVKGVGEKGAAKLISQYKTLEGIYENIDSLKGKLKENLENDREMAFLSRKLVTLKCDLAVPALSSLKAPLSERLTHPDLQAFYDEFEFRSLLESDLFEKVAPRPKARAFEGVSIKEEVLDLEGVKKFIEYAEKHEKLGIQVAGEAGDVMQDTVGSLSLSVDKEKIVVIDLEQKAVKETVTPFLTAKKRQLVGHDLKWQLQALKNTGIAPLGVLKDTMIMDYLLDSNQTAHGMEAVKARYLQDREPRKPRFNASLSLHLAAILEPRLAGYGLKRVFEDIEMPLLRVLAHMEQQGIFLDEKVLKKLSKELSSLEESCASQIYRLAGGAFNIQSPKQLQKVLFEDLKVPESLGIKSIKKTKTGFSTDESVLKQLMAHPIAKALLEYREVTKLKNTYVDTLPNFINTKSKRVHSTFHQTGTATGRLSSDHPNLQNIPLRSALGKEIRKAFCCSKKDHILVSADYSQVEIRLLAGLSGADHLIRAFKEGLDIHSATAARIFGLPLEEVDSVLRGRAKAVNFGIIYGMGPKRLSQETGVSLKEAKSFVDKYFESFPEIKGYLESLKQKALERGYSQTVTGRRRPMQGLKDANKAVAARWQNIAVNTPIQGSAADLIKLAMIDIHQKLLSGGYASRMLVQVHDELVFECALEEKEALCQLVKESMESAMNFACPLVVDIGFGENWLAAH